MAFPAAAFVLSYLLAVSSTGQLSMNIGVVQKLVDYRYTTELGELIPGVAYNSSINVSWAISDSALRGLDGQVVTVKATASASNDSGISFSSPFGIRQETAEAYLQCAVADGTCSNSSNLSAIIPFTVLIGEGQADEEAITVKSEIVGAAPPIDTSGIASSAGGLFDSFKNVFSQNDSASGQNQSAAPAATGSAANASGNGNFLDSLRPEGDSNNPLEFLRANPIISIAALAIVIIITGAYLINAKD